MTEKQLAILKHLPEIMIDFRDLFPTAHALLDSYEKNGALKLSVSWVQFVLSNYIGLSEVYLNKDILPQVLAHANPITRELVASLHYTQVMATLTVYLSNSPHYNELERFDFLKEQVAYLCDHVIEK